MLLTEQEISEILSFPWEKTVDFVRRVEVRIGEKLKAQEPFGYFRADAFCWTDCAETDDGAKPLYEHQLPPDDVVRDAERYRFLRDVGQEVVEVFIKVKGSNAPDEFTTWHGYSDMDGAIDAAMKEMK